MTMDLAAVPARRGRAVRLQAGQAIRIVNTHGQQVVDTWCYNAEDMGEFMSMEHLHATLPLFGAFAWSREKSPLPVGRCLTKACAHDVPWARPVCLAFLPEPAGTPSRLADQRRRGGNRSTRLRKPP